MNWGTLIGQTIKGSILNHSSNNAIIFSYSNGLTIKKDSALVTDKGEFLKNFNFDEPKYVTFQYSAIKKKIYIFPKARFRLVFDGSDQIRFNNSFKISGDYSINKYLDTITTNDLHYIFIRNNVNIDLPIDSFAKVLKEFRSFSNSLRQRFFKNTNQNKRSPDLAIFLTNDSINWYSYSILIANDYAKIIKTGNKELFRRTEIERRMLLKHSDSYLISEFYKRLWFFVITGEFETKLQTKDSTNLQLLGFTGFALKYINARQVKGKLKQVVVSQLLNSILEHYTYGSPKEIMYYDSIIATVKPMLTDGAFLKEFEQQYSNCKKIIISHKIGKRAPDFKLVDTAGIRYYLKDFEGKVLLIDVWASWCGPCVKEFPYLKALEDQLKPYKQFQLLSISTDDTREKWVKNGLLKLGPPGFSLWVGYDKEFITDYNISLIPVLLLLDKNGKFIEFDLPKASEGDKLFELIKRSLQDL